MRPTKLLLLALALGAAALVSLQLRRTDDAAAETKTALVPTALLDGARALTITLKPTGKTVTVEKGADGVWAVKEKHGLPADLENRLIPLFRALQKAENFGVLTANPKRIEKLNLDSALRLTAADGKVTEITFGKTTDDGLGAAATVADGQGGTQAVRTSFTGFLEADPANWFDPVLFTAKGEELRALTFTWPDGTQTFARAEKGKPFAGKEGAVLEEMSNVLMTLRANDAVAKGDKDAAAAFAKPWSIQLELFDGAKVTLTLAKTAATGPNESPKLWMRVAHSDPKHKANGMTAKAEFIAPPWLAEQLPATLADFRKAVEPPPAGPAPGAGPTLNIPGLGPVSAPPGLK
ncbi:MAG: DUF4340 domain-containing protein [Opitutia bacterium]